MKTVGFGVFDFLACLALKAMSKIDVGNWKDWNGWDERQIKMEEGDDGDR